MSVQVEALADEVFLAADAQNRAGAGCTRHPFGEIISNPDYPHLFFLHYIAGLVAPDWDLRRLERVIEEEMPTAAYFRAASRDSNTRDRLGRALEEAGYQAEHKLAMVQVADPELSGEPAVSVTEVRDETHWRQLTPLILEDWADQGEAAAAELVRLYRWRAAKLPQRYFLAYQEGQPVGFGGLYQYQTTGYLHAIFTARTARGRGIGTSVVFRLLQGARASGCDRMALKCRRQSGLPDYYRRLGFRTVGEEFTWMKPR